ncbi:MAG: hypothetical protein EOP83_06975, partial [Verrucomicrobiaceae bacterium]
MRVRLPVILVGTHLLALGVGWWCLRPSEPESMASQEASRASKQSERSPRQERRVSTAELLAAYSNSALWGESQKLRMDAYSTRQIPANPVPAPKAQPEGGQPKYIKPEQRAAETDDMAGALEKELEAVNGSKTYDYQYTKALIARWMKEDPAACAAWLGQMQMRGGWGDPFDAFAKTLPPTELLKLMEQGWLQRNRRYALEYLAREMGGASAAGLPDVLAVLGEEDAKRFLENASSKAKVEDAAVWLELLAGDTEQLQSVVSQWIQNLGSNQRGNDGKPGDWQEKADLILEAATGTPAEEMVRKKIEAAQREAEIRREITRVAQEPAAATAALVDLYLKQGKNEAEARRLASEAISQSYQSGLEVWKKDAWEQGLQLSLLGEQKLDDVLISRLNAIDSELPEVLQGGTRNQMWSEAMEIDPGVTMEVARQNGRVDEALQSAAKLVRESATSQALRAEILLTLSE